MTRRVLSVAILLTATVSACAGGAQQKSGVPVAQQSSTAPVLPVPPELRVPEPKLASGIPPCELLSPEQLRELGLKAEDARTEATGRAHSCTWFYADKLAAAGVTMTNEPGSMNLAGLYSTRDTFGLFEPTVISGHPAVRADDGEGDVCTLYVAVSNEQLMSADGDVSGTGDLRDACAVSRRIAEFVLSNLPPKP